MVLRLILGDQLNIHHSWFSSVSQDVIYVMMEVRSETDYTVHHVQKVAAFFIAMRAFAQELRRRGHRVEYLDLEHVDNRQGIVANLRLLADRHGVDAVEYQEPDEYRVDQTLRDYGAVSAIPVVRVCSEHFFEPRESLANFFAGKSSVVMESYYRFLRKKHSVLMDGLQPVGDCWNFDAENRKAVPKGVHPPAWPVWERDISEYERLFARCGVRTMGSAPGSRILWPLTREEACAMLEDFCENRLEYFGDYQDAMTVKSETLWHSGLSFCLNAKILSPAEVVDRAVEEWRRRPRAISLAAVEGFVRQILGWREFVRGVYWREMPSYALRNMLNNRLPLPGWFWTGEVKMRCMSHSIGQSLRSAYAHHIQRLMVIGNFALLYGAHPDEVDSWYLGVYIDALEWVMMPNTRGMSQYADGGVVATKPYISAAAYINKMSDYCKGCCYDRSSRSEESSCPFNALYWDFVDRNRKVMAANRRIGFVVGTWDKFSDTEKAAIRSRAAFIRENVESV